MPVAFLESDDLGNVVFGLLGDMEPRLIFRAKEGKGEILLQSPEGKTLVQMEAWVWVDRRLAGHHLGHSVPFRSILFHSVSFNSNPFHSVPFCSILFHSVPF